MNRIIKFLFNPSSEFCDKLDDLFSIELSTFELPTLGDKSLLWKTILILDEYRLQIRNDKPEYARIITPDNTRISYGYSKGVRSKLTILKHFGNIKPGDIIMVDKKDEHFRLFGIYGGDNAIYAFYDGKVIETTAEKFTKNAFCCYNLNFKLEHRFNKKERMISIIARKKDNMFFYGDSISAPNTYRLFSKRQTLKRIEKLLDGSFKKQRAFEDCEQFVIWCKTGHLKGTTESTSFIFEFDDAASDDYNG